jgi:hypothetical protein
VENDILTNEDSYTPGIPSQRRDVLKLLEGSTICRFVRYSWWPPEETAEKLGIPSSTVFSQTAGPVLLTLDAGVIIGAASDPALISVMLWIELGQGGLKSSFSVMDDTELFAVDASDPTYCTSDMAAIVHRQIQSVRVLVRTAKNAKWVERPREAGILLSCGNGHELVLSHGLHNDSDDFSVIAKGQINPNVATQLHEVALSEIA